MAIKRDRSLLWLSLPMILCIASILLIAALSQANTTTPPLIEPTQSQGINEIDELGPTLTTIHIAELHDPKQNVSVIGIAGEQYTQNETIRTPPVLILVAANGTVLNTTQAAYPVVMDEEKNVNTEKDQLDPIPHPTADPAGFVSSSKKESHTKQHQEEEEEEVQLQQEPKQQTKSQQDRILVSRYLHGVKDDENGEPSHDPRIGNRVIIISIILFLIAGFFAVYWVTRSAQQEELRKHYQEFKVIQQHSVRLSGLGSPRTPHAHGMGSSRQHSKNHAVYGNSYQNRSLDDDDDEAFMLDLSPQATGADDNSQQQEHYHNHNHNINNNKNPNKPGGTNYQTFE